MISDPRLHCLACPRCRGDVETGGETWLCGRCSLAFPRREGLVDFSPESLSRPALVQRILQSPVVAGIYEGLFRPALRGLGSQLGYAQERAFLDQHLHAAPGPVLDLGCGTGRNTAQLAERVGAARVIAIDVSLPMLDKARANARRQGNGDVLFLRASALALPFKDGSLGAVSCFGVLHLLPDPKRAIAGIVQAMAPGATIVCVTMIRVQGALQSSAHQVLRRPVQSSFFDGDDVARSLREQGLTILEVRRHRMVMMIAARKDS